MISDKDTNFVYVSDLLGIKHPAFYRRLIVLLEQNQIAYDTLKGTSDIWAVDYMPIQVTENKFVQFSYQPDYLMSTKKGRKTISNVSAICKNLNISPIQSDIILDGGNVVRGENKVIMTTKLFLENPKRNETSLIEELQNLFEIDSIVFIPQDNGDWLGHSDGAVRFITDDTVFVNDPKAMDKRDYINLHCALRNAGLQLRNFPYEESNTGSLDNATGLYLNYLELKDFIILPTFGLATDKEAIEITKETFPAKNVLPLRSNEIAKQAGVLNCISWNIYKP
jgi:agmatine deiminase